MELQGRQWIVFAEINGKPRLMCMTRMDDLPEGRSR